MVENRARERLTGAAILVAVIVLLVPELLSGPRRAMPQALAVIDEAPVRSYTLSLGDAQQSTAGATADGARADWPPANAATARAADATARTSATAPTPAAARAVESPALEAPVKPVTGTPAKPVTGTAGSAAIAAIASPARPGEWAVQVGSFGSRENADRLAHSLKLKGYGAFVSESSSRGRNWYRVRVGPERDRTAADAVATRLRAAGLRGAVAQPR